MFTLREDVRVRVSYLELTQCPAPVPLHSGAERISREKPTVGEYLGLYRRVGRSVRWDQRLKMARSELIRLLESERSHIYILRDGGNQALGFCEFERSSPDIELKNFGLVFAARGKGLASW